MQEHQRQFFCIFATVIIFTKYLLDTNSFEFNNKTRKGMFPGFGHPNSQLSENKNRRSTASNEVSSKRPSKCQPCQECRIFLMWFLSFDSWRFASSDASSQLSKWIKAESRHYQCFEETQCLTKTIKPTYCRFCFLLF